MLCELNARRGSGEQLTDNERIIADSYGGGGEVDINAESLEFDIAALLGKIVSRVTLRYQYVYLQHPVYLPVRESEELEPN